MEEYTKGTEYSWEGQLISDVSGSRLLWCFMGPRTNTHCPSANRIRFVAAFFILFKLYLHVVQAKRSRGHTFIYTQTLDTQCQHCYFRRLDPANRGPDVLPEVDPGMTEQVRLSARRRVLCRRQPPGRIEKTDDSRSPRPKFLWPVSAAEENFGDKSHPASAPWGLESKVIVGSSIHGSLGVAFIILLHYRP